jgi:hypothetical protein
MCSYWQIHLILLLIKTIIWNRWEKVQFSLHIRYSTSIVDKLTKFDTSFFMLNDLEWISDLTSMSIVLLRVQLTNQRLLFTSMNMNVAVEEIYHNKTASARVLASWREFHSNKWNLWEWILFNMTERISNHLRISIRQWQ